MATKLDFNIFKAYEKKIECDRAREERNIEVDYRLHSLERALPKFVTKEDNELEMKEKASLEKFEDLQAMLEKTKQIHLTDQEELMKKLDTLKEQHEEKTKELIEQMQMLETKIDDIEEEGEEEESYDDEDDEDLGSELEDTFDVNDLGNKPGPGTSPNSSKSDLEGDGEEQKGRQSA